MSEINGTFGVTNLCDELNRKRKPAKIVFFEFSILERDKKGTISLLDIIKITANGRKPIRSYQPSIESSELSSADTSAQQSFPSLSTVNYPRNDNQ